MVFKQFPKKQNLQKIIERSLADETDDATDAYVYIKQSN